MSPVYTASSWVRSTRNLKPSADARISPLFGAPTPPKPTTEGLLFSFLLYDLAVVHAMNIRRPIADGYLHAGA